MLGGALYMIIRILDENCIHESAGHAPYFCVAVDQHVVINLCIVFLRILVVRFGDATSHDELQELHGSIFTDLSIVHLK